MMELSASILDADLTQLGAVVSSLCESGIRRIHVDIMDGHFVPNLSFGPQMVRALRPICDRYGARANAHLMVEHPDQFLAAFADAGAHGITVHVETADPLRTLLADIRARGLDVGIALNPDTPIARVVDVLDIVDWCLVMTVHPGFGRQPLITGALDKVQELSQIRTERTLGHLLIAVDGGVHAETIVDVLKAGADVAVVGSALFDARRSVTRNLADLRTAIAGAATREGEHT